MSERGKYIVIEGNDGTGKSTQADRVQKRLKEVYDVDAIQIHEPDGFEGSERLGLPAVPAATALRKKIKDATIPRTPWQNVEWFTESRKLNWEKVMEPALERGIWVIAARNYISTLAYQGYGEGIEIGDIMSYTRKNVGWEYLRPDIEIVLTLGDEAIRRMRISDRGELEVPDTFESKDDEFQTKVNDAYWEIAWDRGSTIIDASQPIDAVTDAIWKKITPVFEQGDERTQR